MKVAIVHDRLTLPGGAEKIVETFLELYPKADLFTTAYKPEFYKNSLIANADIFIDSSLNVLANTPFVSEKILRYFFSYYPKFFESLDLSGYDLIISSSSIAAHGVITGPDQLHIAYIHTPLRYVYSHFHELLQTSFLKYFRIGLSYWGLGSLFLKMANNFRLWNFLAIKRPNYIIANSKITKLRLKQYLNQETDLLLHPPVEYEKIKTATKQYKKLDFYLILSRLQDYKRIDLAIKTFQKYFKNKRLVIIGKGPAYSKLKSLAKNSNNIKLLGFVPDKAKFKLLAQAKALIIPGKEDFGIAMLEAMAAGTPVIAYKAGGAKEIINSKTGILFNVQDPYYLAGAIDKFEKIEHKFKAQVLQEHAKKFAKTKFKYKFTKFIEHKYKVFHKSRL